MADTHSQAVQSGHAVHHDDHGHHDHHHGNFWTQYVFSTDHKVIAKQFLITGIIMAIFGVLMSTIFRLQLAFPDTPIPFLETILGKWAPGGQLDPNFYLALVTMHGTFMVFSCLQQVLVGLSVIS